MSTHLSVERLTQAHEPHIRLLFLRTYGVLAPASLSYLYRNIEGNPRSTFPLFPGQINGVSVVIDDEDAPIEVVPFMFPSTRVFFHHHNHTWNDTQKRVIFWWYPPPQLALSQAKTVNFARAADNIDSFVDVLAAPLTGAPQPPEPQQQAQTLPVLAPEAVKQALDEMKTEQELNQLIDMAFNDVGSLDPSVFGL